jgi:hypothetical protein
MKRLNASLLLMCGISFSLFSQQPVSISMGAGYANDLYYSLPGGLIKSEPAQNWHLAFTVRPIDASIMINESAGVKAYLASNNANDWSTLDTTGMHAQELHNSPADWALGAFANLGVNHPDYGWGEYNQITHNVNGTRIFVIELADGSFRKFFVEEMGASNQTFTFRLANLDGSNEITRSAIKTDYAGKNFFYYNLLDDQFLDREPLSSTWDLIARRYDIEIPAGPMVFHYIVSGIQSNLGVQSAEVRGAMVSAADSVNYTLSDEDISTIGSDWKSFDNATFTWSIVDSLSYFVSSRSGGVYHLTFTGFGGSGNGQIDFTQSPAQSIGVDEPMATAWLPYPNPVIDRVRVPLGGMNGAVVLRLSDLHGRLVKEVQTIAEGNDFIELDLSTLPTGTYQVELQHGSERFNSRILIR